VFDSSLLFSSEDEFGLNFVEITVIVSLGYVAQMFGPPPSRHFSENLEVSDQTVKLVEIKG
jgi:hypothetical protein